MPKLSAQTVETVISIIGLHASPASIASAVNSATQSEMADAALAAANAVESFAGLMAKAASKAAPPLLIGSLLNDAYHMQDDYNRLGKYSDSTLTAIAADISAAFGLIASGVLITASAPAAITITVAAVGITAAAALSVAVMSQSKDSNNRGQTPIYLDLVSH